jgi:hypothetical protein|nr:MAG TPA: hypothetical protein [Caudoviricetes sp.]
MSVAKQEKLKNEILKIYDTGKSKIIKKYNLSLYDIQTIEELVKKQNKYFIQGNVAKLLKDYGYIIKNYGIGFELEVLQ